MHLFSPPQEFILHGDFTVYTSHHTFISSLEERFDTDTCHYILKPGIVPVK